MFAAQEANEFSEHPREEVLVAYEQPNKVPPVGPEYTSPQLRNRSGVNS